jgi:hypothetical protein
MVSIDLRDVDDSLSSPRCRLNCVEPEDDAEVTSSLHVERLDRRHHRHGVVLILAHGVERLSLRRLDADEQPRNEHSRISDRISGRLAMLSVARGRMRG